MKIISAILVLLISTFTFLSCSEDESTTPQSNNPPTTPSNPSPIDQATDVSRSPVLSWTCSDPNAGDSIKYDLFFSFVNPPNTQITSGWIYPNYSMTGLDSNQTYYWRITAKDSKGASSVGPIWRFTTSTSTGHFIVFDRSVGGHADIFIANVDGTNISNLTNNSAEDFHPRLNAANDKILFISDRSGQANVFVMNVDGTNVQQVTTGGVSGGQNNVWNRAFADFTSDNKIVFCKGNKLYKINVDGTNNLAIATAPSDNWERVSCSRTGNKIAALTMGSWSYNEKIYIMNPDGSNMQVLVPDNPGGIYLGTFTPDGSRVAYIYDISGHEESSGCQVNNHVFVINIDGTNNTDISGNKVAGMNDYYPAITPDGQKVIFSNGPGCGGGTSSPNIWIMNIDGSNRQQIITDGYVVDTN